MKRKLLVWGMLVAMIAALGFSASSSAAPVAYVHSVWSQKPVAVGDGLTGGYYTANGGNAAASWTSNPLSSGDQAFFNAIVDANGNHYEFRLIQTVSTTPDQIDGIFDIYKNFVLVAPAVKGSVNGLSQPIGNAFKFYDSSYKWHVAAYITNRFDY